MSNKTVFTKTELNKFLLLGETGEYLIDKINPCIRAIKRKEILSIFCTVRIKKNTTTVKLGEFPKNDLEEIYSKFKVAKNISTNGNNPNIVLSSIIKKTDSFNNNQLNNLNFEKLLEIFFQNKQKLSEKYRIDFLNCLKKNLKKNYYQPVRLFKKKQYLNIIESLHENGKLGTIKSFIYKINTLGSFFLVNENLDCSLQLKELIALTPKISKKYIRSIQKEKPVLKKINNELKKLKNSDLQFILQTINDLKK
jgi:hypothetical protein